MFFFTLLDIWTIIHLLCNELLMYTSVTRWIDETLRFIFLVIVSLLSFTISSQEILDLLWMN